MSCTAPRGVPPPTPSAWATDGWSVPDSLPPSRSSTSGAPSSRTRRNFASSDSLGWTSPSSQRTRQPAAPPPSRLLVPPASSSARTSGSAERYCQVPSPLIGSLAAKETLACSSPSAVASLVAKAGRPMSRPAVKFRSVVSARSGASVSAAAFARSPAAQWSRKARAVRSARGSAAREPAAAVSSAPPEFHSATAQVPPPATSTAAIAVATPACRLRRPARYVRTPASLVSPLAPAPPARRPQRQQNRTSGPQSKTLITRKAIAICLSLLLMDLLRHLRYFRTVAEEQHFGRTAERLRLAQPSLSQRIQRLERELGVRLFDPGSRGVALTPAGRLVRAEADALLAAADRLDSVVARVRDGAAGTLRAAVPPDLGGPTVAALLTGYQDRSPGSTLDLRGLTTVQQVRELAVGTLEAGVVRHPCPAEGLDFGPLLHQPLGVLLRADDPLAAASRSPTSPAVTWSSSHAPRPRRCTTRR